MPSDRATCYLYFSDRLNIPAGLSFDRALDKLHNMSLFQMKCVVSSKFSKEYQVMMDKVEFVTVISEP